MKIGIVLVALALLAVLMGSAWMRRAEWDVNGESGAMLLGLVACVAAVAFIVAAVAGWLWA